MKCSREMSCEHNFININILLSLFDVVIIIIKLMFSYKRQIKTIVNENSKYQNSTT